MQASLAYPNEQMQEGQMSVPLAGESERRSLQYFRDHAEELAASVRRTGHPIVLTDANEGELVLQDAVNYARMKAESEEFATIRAIQEGIEAAAAGDVMRAADYFRGLRERLALRS
jgi:PHD/YefM family antitoxin component YafN of YafNO toxin-antitoxin module